MSQRAENVKLTLEAMVKGYHECSFAVSVGYKFIGHFLIIETFSKKVWLFWYPKNIPGWFCPAKDILHGITVLFMFPSIDCGFIDFESL